MAKKKEENKSGLISNNETVADNKRARFEYHIEETFDAGIVLAGTEVKSLRLGQCSIKEAHVGPKGNELFLWNAHIPEYQQAGAHLQHEPKRPRKLLLHTREIKKLSGSITREGYTLIPLKMYFNNRGLVKVKIGLGKGKKLHDKRETKKERDWGREKQRIFKERN